MAFVKHIFEGAETLWLVWFSLLTVWSIVTTKLVSAIRRRKFCLPSFVLRDESGAAYSLGFMFTVPLYILFCGAVFEVTFLIVAKIGTVYAATAGARSVAVWYTHDRALAQDRFTQAVLSGLAPFSVSTGFEDSSGASSGRVPAVVDASAADYFVATQKFNEPRILDREQTKDHFQRLFHRTSMKFEVKKFRHGEDIDVTVEYRAPLMIPGVAAFIDPDHKRPFQFRMASRILMTIEAPVSANKKLGIEYRPF